MSVASKVDVAALQETQWFGSQMYKVGIRDNNGTICTVRVIKK